MAVGLRSDSAWENDPLRHPGSACWSLCPRYATAVEWHVALRMVSGLFCAARMRSLAGTATKVKGGLCPPGLTTHDGGRPGGGPDPRPLDHWFGSAAVVGVPSDDAGGNKRDNGPFGTCAAQGPCC